MKVNTGIKPLLFASLLGSIIVPALEGEASAQFTSYNFAITRQEGDGVLDDSFASDGKEILGFGTADTETAYAVARDSNNGLVTAGIACDQNGLGISVDCQVALARFTASGSVDTNYGLGDYDGKVLLQPPGADGSFARDVVAAGTSVIIGGGATINGSYKFLLAKFDSNGELDDNFGDDGIVITDFASTSNESISALLRLSNGNILAVGTADGQFAVARYTSNGDLDETFDGSDGKVLVAFASQDNVYASAVGVTSANRYIIGGTAIDSGVNRIALAAVKASDGTLDTAFDDGVGADGKVLASWASQQHTVDTLAIDGSDRIIVGGSFGNKLGVARFASDGSVDDNFGDNGRKVVDAPGMTMEKVTGLALSGTNIVLGGSGATNIDSSGYQQRQIVTAKLNSSGGLVTSFGSSGIQTINFASRYTEEANDLIIDNNGNIVTVGSCSTN